MRRITRDVRPADLQHLLDHPPRAYLAFTDGDAVDAVPVRFRYAEGRYYVGVAADVGHRLRPDAPVALLLDAGWYFYELQCIRMRGMIRAAAALSDDAATMLVWFEVVPRTVVAWDYRSLREADADAPD